MNDPKMTLLSTALEAVLQNLSQEPSNPSPWSAARSALQHFEFNEQDDPELATAIASEDRDALGAIVEGWNSGQRLLLVRDRDVLKRALKAYRKRLKITLLDAESTVSGGPMSAGRHSSIVGIVPPERYPRSVWDKLAQQKRLIDRGQGTFELAPGV